MKIEKYFFVGAAIFAGIQAQASDETRDIQNKEIVQVQVFSRTLNDEISIRTFFPSTLSELILASDRQMSCVYRTQVALATALAEITWNDDTENFRSLENFAHVHIVVNDYKNLSPLDSYKKSIRALAKEGGGLLLESALDYGSDINGRCLVPSQADIKEALGFSSMNKWDLIINQLPLTAEKQIKDTSAEEEPSAETNELQGLKAE